MSDKVKLGFFERLKNGIRLYNYNCKKLAQLQRRREEKWEKAKRERLEEGNRFWQREDENYSNYCRAKNNLKAKQERQLDGLKNQYNVY